MRFIVFCAALLLPMLVSAQQIDALNQQIMQLYGQERYEEATPLATQLVGLLERQFGADSLQMASGLNNLAELYAKQHKLREAEQLYRRSLAIRESQLGPDHPDVVKSRNRLAEVLQSEREAAPPPPPPAQPKRDPPQPRPNPAAQEMNRAITLNQQALELSKQGKLAEALPLAKQVLAIFEKNLPADHPNLAIGIGNLAQIHAQMGQYDEALALYQRALPILEKTPGVNLGFLLANIADTHAQKHDFPEAEAYYKRGLPILEKALGSKDATVSRILNNLAEVYRAQGKVPELDPLMKGRVAPARMALPGTKLAPEPMPIPNPDDIEHAADLDKTLFQLTEQKKFADALPVALQQLALLEKMYGKDSLAVAVHLDNMVEIYHQLGRDKEAEPLIIRGKTIRDRSPGQRPLN